MRFLFGLAIGFSIFVSSLSAQEAVIRERRAVIVENTDFFGADLTPIFEINLDACQRACLLNSTCKAFTYNQKSRACFPKSGVDAEQTFAGALSARIINTSSSILTLQTERLAELSFLPESYFEEAQDVGQKMAGYFPVNGWSFEDNLSEIQNSRAQANLLAEIRATGRAAVQSDRGDFWTESARLMLLRKSDDRSSMKNYRRFSSAFAIHGFLRATSAPEQANALNILAQALELRDRGRTSIDALRLSNTLSRRLETSQKLARAINLFGFRIVDHQVDSNAPSPRICVNFSEPLKEAGVEYTDYLQLPGNGIVAEAKGAQLCLSGVTHGQRYGFSLRQGLPAQSGEVLETAVPLDIYVRDRDPQVRFAGRAYILPRTEDASIPVVTVNLETVDLKLFRVDERGVLGSIQDRYFGRPLSGWDEEELANSIGEVVWTGTGSVRMSLNEEVTTRLPVADAIEGLSPGVYALRAIPPGADIYDGTAQTQWFVISDLGIASMSGDDGLHVFVRSLADASVLEGIEVNIIAANNAVLATAITDARGYVVIEPGLLRGSGGARPAIVSVSDGNDYAFLNLREAPFDLSDRGVEGHPSTPPIDIFATTDRGIYRPGETVNATVIARDDKGMALAALPLVAIVRRADGVEFARYNQSDQGAGGRVFDIQIPDSAVRGSWRMDFHTDVSAPALQSVSFLVEDFVPEKIDFDMAFQAGTLTANDIPQIDIDARYLYGAVGVDLGIEGEVRLSTIDTLDAFPGYRFGRHEDPQITRTSFIEPGFKTDSSGKALVSAVLPAIGQTTRPLVVSANVRLREGSGRPVERRASREVTGASPLIGIKTLFDGSLGEGQVAQFELIGISADLTPENMEVEWQVNRVNTRYQWYENYGSWNWEPVTTRERIASGTGSLSGTASAVEAVVEWGEYELVVKKVGGDYAAASVGFYAGWYASADASSTPDTLEVSLDRAQYKQGDMATLKLVPRTAGNALITVASNHLIDMRVVPVSQGLNEIELPVTEEWGAGAYVAATVISPLDAGLGQNPSRAIGLQYASVDPEDKTLSVSMDIADEIEPRNLLPVSLNVSGAVAGQQVYATIAAVDLGVLNVTGFQSPDPSDHYFGQRKLGFEMRDVYGRLINGLLGEMGAIRSGGDGLVAAKANAAPPNERVVSLFSGLVELDANGHATVDFDIPEFNGTLRVMATVWSESGVGEADADVLVRDPIVVVTSSPRFLAPGDESRILIELSHATGPTGDIDIDISASAGVFADKGSVPTSITLSDGEKSTLSLPIIVSDVGDPEIQIVVTTPEGKILRKTIAIAVRANDPEVAITRRFSLDAGSKFTFDANVFDGLQTGTGHANVSVGTLARFDAPGLLESLDRYPYGCTEQITSKAMPLLYFDEVAQAMGLSARANVATRISQAIAEVLSNQAASGSFGLWRPGSGDLWLDAYVTDFLSRASEQGFDVPTQAFRIALDNLRNRVNYTSGFEYGGEGLAYALMVLAREGDASMGDLRYYSDARADNLATPLALAQLGSALAMYGDQIRADAMFSKAQNRIEQEFAKSEGSHWRSDYGSNLRDAAAVLTLAVEAGSDVVDRTVLSGRITGPSSRRSTQEALWTLLATNALIKDNAGAGITVNGVSADGPLVRVLDAQTMTGQSFVFDNTTAQSEAITLTTFGIPQFGVPAGGQGYSIERSYYTLDGQLVDVSEVALNTRLAVVLRVSPHRNADGRLMVNDPLPAGFEIDNPNIVRAGEVKALEWLKLNANPRHSEFRTDRFLAAVDWRSNEPFNLAYIVRAVSPGSFHHPAASVEDMYRPEMRARSETGRVVIR